MRNRHEVLVLVRQDVDLAMSVSDLIYKSYPDTDSAGDEGDDPRMASENWEMSQESRDLAGD